MNRNTRIILFLVLGLVVIMFLVLLTVIKVPGDGTITGEGNDFYPWIIFFPIFGGAVIPVLALRKKEGKPLPESNNRALLIMLILLVALVIAGLFFLFS